MKTLMLLALPLSLALALPAADALSTHSLDVMGERPALSQSVDGLSKLFAGETDAARTAFEEALKKDSGEVPALYSLNLDAAAHNDFQRALELLCKAAVSTKRGPWSELFIEDAWTLLSFCKDPAPFEKLTERALKENGRGDALSPQACDLLRLRGAEWQLLRGQYAEAQETAKPLAFVNAWALIGPFDNRDKSGFVEKHEPEEGVDFDRPAAGRNRSVTWFPHQVTAYDGRVMLSEIIDPRTHSLAYAVTHVRADTAGPAVLRASFGGAFAVWVNGAPAGTVNDYNDFGVDKLVTPIVLRKGWNEILVKSAVVEDTDWCFSVRLCRPQGGPLAGITYDNSHVASADYKAQVAVPSPPLRGEGSGVKGEGESTRDDSIDLGLVEVLERHVKEHPTDPLALSAYAAMLHIRKYGDSENPVAPKHVVVAAALAPKCVFLRLQLANISDDSNQARQAAEAAYAMNPEWPEVLEMLAYLAHQSRMHVVAEEYARRALAVCGPEKATWSALILADELAGFDAPLAKPAGKGSPPDASPRHGRAEAWRLLSNCVRAHPYWAEAWSRFIPVLESQVEVHSTLQRALSFCGGESALRAYRVESLTRTGRESEAAAYFAEGLNARPFNAARLQSAATQFRHAGDYSSALHLLENASQNAPENPDLLSALAYDKHRAGETTEAVRLLKEVLRLKPGSPQIKDYLAQLDTGRSVDRLFFAEYDIPLKLCPECVVDSYPSDNVAYILNQEVVRVYPNGSAAKMVHRITKLLRSAGLGEVRSHNIWYEPDRQIVDILRAAVITPDGRELSRAHVQDRSTSAAMGVETLIYDEHHLKQVTFNDLEPGAIIDLQYTVRDSGENIFGDYFADTFYFADGQPTLVSQYVLDYPKTLHVQTKTFNTETKAEHVDGKDDQREIVKWELRNVPGIIRERGMPPVVEKLPQLQVTTMRSWQDVGVWYWNLARDQLNPSDELRTVVRDITRDAKTQTEKLRAIHDWVIAKIRYLGIEFGRNGYRPHKVSETYKALYGDCKDTAALITSMLRETGIDCRLVLIRTINAGAIPPDSLPMPNLYNHCIAYVPDVDGKDYWIDGTTDFFQLGEVPFADLGAQVLVVGPNGGQFVKIPEAKAADNTFDQKFTVKLSRSGAAELTIRDTRHGQFAPGTRELVETPGKYETTMKDFAARHFNGAEVLNLNTAGARERDAWTEMTLKVPQLGTPSGDRTALPATFDSLSLSQRYAAEAKRTHPLDFYYPWARKMEINYVLDPATKTAALPEEADINEPFAKYTRHVRQSIGTVIINEELEMTKSLISPEEYEAFKTFCNKVDSLMDQRVLIEGK